MNPSDPNLERVFAAESSNETGLCEGCNGSGIRVPATPLCQIPSDEIDGWTIVERCDACETYDDDLIAAAVVFGEVRWVECVSLGEHAIGRHPIGSASVQS
jgi:hypothetical protein